MNWQRVLLLFRRATGIAYHRMPAIEQHELMEPLRRSVQEARKAAVLANRRLAKEIRKTEEALRQ